MTTTQSPVSVDLDALEALADRISCLAGLDDAVLEGDGELMHEAVAELRAHREREARSKGGEHRAWVEGYAQAEEDLDCETERTMRTENPYPAEGVSDGWIACSPTSMPPSGQLCAVLYDGDQVGAAFTHGGSEWFEDRSESADGDYPFRDTVTHWQEMPSPPATSGGDGA